MTEVPRIDEWNPTNIPDGHWIDGIGDEVWIKDGNYYRTDGPAIISTYGEMEWCLDGVAYTFDDWLKYNTYITDKQKLFLKLKYG